MWRFGRRVNVGAGQGGCKRPKYVNTSHRSKVHITKNQVTFEKEMNDVACCCGYF